MTEETFVEKSWSCSHTCFSAFVIVEGRVSPDLSRSVVGLRGMGVVASLEICLSQNGI